jgi:hypothetical protein
MTSGQDVSEYLDILGLVKSDFSSFFCRKKIKKIKIFFLWCSADAPEDEVICLYGGFLPNPDVPLSPNQCTIPLLYTVFSEILNAKIGSTLTKSSTLRMTLNIDGQFPEQPNVSETCRFLRFSFSLSSHRHSYMGLVFTSHFCYSY